MHTRLFSPWIKIQSLCVKDIIRASDFGQIPYNVIFISWIFDIGTVNLLVLKVQLYLYQHFSQCIVCTAMQWVGLCVPVCTGIQSEDKDKFFIFKVRTFWQCKVKISVHALWLGALSSLFPYMGIGGYGCYPLFVCARHVHRCVKKCPHFECVIHRFVHALNAGTDTLYTRVYSVSSLWMLEQVGGCVCVCETWTDWYPVGQAIFQCTVCMFRSELSVYG